MVYGPDLESKTSRGKAMPRKNEKLTPQACHHFTRFDQVDRPVGAIEAVPDISYRGRHAEENL